MSTTTESTPNAAEAAGGLPFSSADEWANFFQKFGTNARTFQDFTNLTPESMEAIYMAGYNQYNAGKYDEAEKIFQLLALLNHFEKRYWVSLGAARQMNGRHEEALKAFGYLAMFDFQSPEPPLYAAKSLIAMEKPEEAVKALRAAVFNSENKPEHAELNQEAKILLELIETNLASKKEAPPTQAQA